MSLILKGIDLPKGDEKLKIEIEPDGTVWIDQGSEWKKREGGAVQILRPHGRLKDVDELIRDELVHLLYHLPNGDTAIPRVDIDNAPTILEAEEADENQI